MSTQSRDTRPEAERVLIELLRNVTKERRLELGLSLCQTAAEMSHMGILQAHPLASEEDRKLIFAEITYGKNIADRVRAYLVQRGR